MNDLLLPPLTRGEGGGDQPGSCVSAVSPTHKIFEASVSGQHDHNHQWVNSPSGFGAAEGHSLLLWDSLSRSLDLSQVNTPSSVLLGGLPAFRQGACDERRMGVGVGGDGYAGSEPGPHTKEREGLRLCLFLALCLVRDRSTEHRWKVKRGQSVQEMDAAAAAGSTLTCKEVFCSKV